MRQCPELRGGLPASVDLKVVLDRTPNLRASIFEIQKSLAVSVALVIVVVAEMFIGSESGLGHKIIDAQQVMNVKTMYAAIMAAGILGYALNILFLAIERRIVHWSGR